MARCPLRCLDILLYSRGKLHCIPHCCCPVHYNSSFTASIIAVSLFITIVSTCIILATNNKLATSSLFLHHHISTKVPDQCNYLSPALGLPHNIPTQRAGRGKVRNKKIPQKLSPSAPCPHNIKQTLGPHQHHADISHLFLFNLH